MIPPAMAIELIRESDVDFARRWEADTDLQRPGAADIYRFASKYCDYVSDIADHAPSDRLSSVFAVVERLMAEGDFDVRNALGTCFLEDLINFVANGRIRSSSVVPYLGPVSRAFCEGWDKTTGGKTAGL